MRIVLTLLCILLLAGCASSPPAPDAATPPEATDEAPLRDWNGNFTFSSVGSLQVLGTYARPGGGDPLPPNCAITGWKPPLDPVRVEVTATWDVQPTEPELLAFAYIRAPGQDAVQDEHVVGTSPLTLTLDVAPLDLAEPSLFVGIHPSPDSPAGTGTTQEVAVSLLIQYRGEGQFDTPLLYPCAYRVG